MFRIERKEYTWEGNYWNPIKEGYEWGDAGLPLIDNEKEACAKAKELANNPYTIGFRVVREKDKKIIKTFEKY